jgi:hypothetical protein
VHANQVEGEYQYESCKGVATKDSNVFHQLAHLSRNFEAWQAVRIKSKSNGPADLKKEQKAKTDTIQDQTEA